MKETKLIFGEKSGVQSGSIDRKAFFGNPFLGNVGYTSKFGEGMR
jgi:hypothetical protein